MEYKKMLEFGEKEFTEIERYCREKGIMWGVSLWDEKSFDFIERFDIDFHKLPSAKLTDKALLEKVKTSKKPVILSAGASDLEQTRKAVNLLEDTNEVAILQCNSAYSPKDKELNLKVIETLRKEFPNKIIGYSEHEEGVTPSVIAAKLGAKIIERHLLKYYKHMQKLRVNRESIKSFKELIHSIKNKGFSNKYPIHISSNGTITGGKLINPLSKTRNKLFLQKGIYFPVILWSPAEKYFKQISNDIKSKHVCVYELKIRINDYGNFLKEIYAIDDIDKWKVKLKNKKMEDYEPTIYFMLLEITNPKFRIKIRGNSYLSDTCHKLKKEIRNKYKKKIPNYFYDMIIHIGDNFEHNEEIIKTVQKRTYLV